MISVKIHTRGTERILAACDHELLGKEFRDGVMRLKVSEAFYKGEDISEETLAERMKNVTIMNLVGERTVSAAQRMGYVSEDAVVTIGGVKHAQAVIM
ncbi:MAG: DUF424 family protein [Methanomassiliicoccaceae archaeon]|jgi:hypothetical protein|nr:DUF424 family protein [Methanomassiliicoccaceae archaeon]